MRRHQHILWIAVLAIALSGVLSACKTKSALDRALGERARWTVLALDWTQAADNTVQLSTRLSGPPNSALDTLTVRIRLKDAAGATLEEVWHVYDLEELPRGGPKDFIIRIPVDGPAEQLIVDPVPLPEQADLPNIPELDGLGS